MYWRELGETRASYEYVRLYRDLLRKWIARFAIVRAVATSSAVGGWAVFQSYPAIWAGIIMISQIADVLAQVFSATSHYEAARELVHELDKILIQALTDWEKVRLGRFDDEEIIGLRRNLMKDRSDVAKKCFPKSDLPERESLRRLAERLANAYFQRMFGGATWR